MDRAKVVFSFVLPAEVRKQGSAYVSSCSLLDVVTQGDSEKEAKENLVEAMQLFLFSCFERGTIVDVLRRAGFLVTSTSVQPRRGAEAIRAPYYPLHVDVPFIPPHLLSTR